MQNIVDKYLSSK